ncbi:hypothetical protein HRG_009486 [Hirsutella rhossiliensis]|uniref:Uncharacterized protein n=1 Tax=Hirsutella rhossiliensis TaxID=111463 RepID=A0A9P8SF51_9HYPO|nr:uncharacterized protein HRG_09486 [Hirsutella rhossiliensis]KAH0959704.1 hypothetical protein HRG_09486 [Hirsutella rhossiliensis]
MAQPSHPTLINLPPPGSNPDTPSEMPGTPTSTTTSLSALSTTAIKDGHRGHFPPGPLGRGHQHSPSATSLEAERADRISRLAGLERVSTLRAAPQTPAQPGSSSSHLSPQTTPTSTTGFPANFPASQHLTAAYFDSNGQPVAVTKMSTVGSASATESHVGEGEGEDARTTAGDRDEDMLSTGTNYREAGSVTSMAQDQDPMDEELDALAARSLGGYDDRMSDDGSASLVGFGEGAGSTVSGPIYQRRPPPTASAGAQLAWNLERTSSGLGSDARRDRDTVMGGAGGGGAPGGGDTPMSASAIEESRDARMMDGVAAEAPHPGHGHGDEAFVDTTFRGPIQASGRQPSRETAERIVQQLDRGERSVGSTALGSPGRGGEPLGKFYFEGGERRED